MVVSGSIMGEASSGKAERSVTGCQAFQRAHSASLGAY